MTSTLVPGDGRSSGQHRRGPASPSSGDGSYTVSIDAEGLQAAGGRLVIGAVPGSAGRGHEGGRISAASRRRRGAQCGEVTRAGKMEGGAEGRGV
jgi:hypothetical protein